MPSRRDRQAITVFPALPVEILSEIFSHLDPSSVRRVLCVNSLFRALARPLAYQYGTATELGLFFPGAENAYPFSKSFEPGFPGSALSNETRGIRTKRLKRIDIGRHPRQVCRLISEVGGSSIHELDVCNIKLHSCTPVTFEEYTEEELALWDGNDGWFCLRINSLLQKWLQTAQKMVIKDIPRTSGYRYHEHMNNFVPTTHISVVYSQAEPNIPDTPHNYANPVLGAYELGMPGCNRLEVLFWTERPGQAWIPRCKYTTGPGRTDTCSKDEGTLWSALATFAVRFPVRDVVVVNSAAVLPPASTVLEHELELRTDQARMQTQHAYQLKAEMELSAKEWGGNWVERFEFITMEEWIRRGGWEDVFTLEEIGPWLAKAEASTGNSLPSIVHVYSLKELAGLSL